MVGEYLFKTNSEENGDISRDATPEPTPDVTPEVNAEATSEESLEGTSSDVKEEETGDVIATVNPEVEQEAIVTPLESEIEEGSIQPTSMGEVAPQSAKTISIVPIILIALLVISVIGMAVCMFIKMKFSREIEEFDDDDFEDDNVKMIKSHEDSRVKIYSIHGVGNREMQQDSFGISDLTNPDEVKKKGFLAVVADGMGGLSDGNRVSQNVVVSMLQGFDESSSSEIPSSKLLKLLVDASDSSMELIGEENAGKSGSTVVATLIKDNCLSWISVGDSHIYAYRRGKLIQLNHDHNYGAELDIQVARGEMSLEDAMSNPQRGALTSFIGMGQLELVDQSEQPIKLEKGDRILLMSDGVFGTLGDELICELMNQPIKEASLAINDEIIRASKPKQDNYTCIIIGIK